MFVHTLKLVALAFLVANLLVLVSWQSFFDQVNEIAYDFTQRLSGEVIPASGALIVGIDEESLDRIGAWPWPRSVQADLIERVGAGLPAALGIDILMDDPGAPDQDAAMRAALSRSDNVVLAARLDNTPGAGERWRLPLPEFLEGASGIGHVHADPDLDTVMRRLVTAKHAEGRVVRAFALEVLDVAGMLPPEYGQDRGGAERIVQDQIRIRFAGDRGTFPQVPAWEVLEGRADTSEFQDRIVLVGATAEGLSDDWMTPFSVSGRRMSGIEIHANALESIYSGRNIGEVPGWIVLMALTGLVLGLGWLERRFEGLRFHLLAVATLPALVAASWFLMSRGLWLPFPTFFLGVALVVPTLGVRKLVRVNRNLDDKISRLSVWAAEPEATASPLSELRARLDRELDDPDLRRQWLGILERYEFDRDGRRRRRERLIETRRHNAPWKLDAVDFFNEQLYRFVSFNDAVLAGIEDVIIVGDPAGQVVYQNTATRSLDGFSDDPGALWEYLELLLNGRRLIEAFARVLASGNPVRFDSLPSASGTRYYALTLSPISDIGVVAVLHDVTAQRELDQTKSDMVSLVSHELRTPLTSIRGYGDMLARYDLVEERGQGFLQSILRETTRLNDLIQSFLDVAAIESGRKALDPTEFEIAPFADDLVTGLDPLAQRKRIAIENAIQGNPGTMKADRVLVYQALSNLIANAIKYSPEETRVRIGVERNDGRIRFLVTDQGYGIPPEEVQRIFEKFYRRSNAETEGETGFGLGLAFVRQVAEQHGGGVEVESEVGRGSVFSLWIPDRADVPS